MKRVCVATPSSRDPKWGYVLCLMRMFWKPHEDCALGYYTCMSSSLNENRRNVVRYAQKAEFSHILWIDDDMVYPDDTLTALLAHEKEIVACNCTTRKMPLVTTASIDHKRIKSANKTGLEEVHQVGFGVILTEVGVFSKIPEPWFATPFDPKANATDTPGLDVEERSYVGEDVFFCNLARHFGLQIWIDHDLSQKIGHIGEFEYNHATLEMNDNGLS